MLISIGISYAYFDAVDKEQNNVNVIVQGKTACIDVTLKGEEINTLTYNYPIEDNFATKNIKPIRLTIKNNCNDKEEIDYSLIITSLKENDKYIPTNSIKIKVNKNSDELIKPSKLSRVKELQESTTKTLLENKLKEEYSSYTKESRVIEKGTIGQSQEITYETYLWIDYNAGNETQG